MALNGRLSSWSSEYSIQVAVVDNQHQKLLMMLRQLYDSIRRGDAVFTVMPQFRAAREYASYHFGYEETLMERHKYPGVEKHKADHLTLSRQLEELEDHYRSANLGVGIPLSDFFAHWLIDHIVTEDKKCGQFLNAVGIR